MKSNQVSLLLFALIFLAGSAVAKPTEPVPITVVNFRGEEIPVYDPGQVRPTTTTVPEFPISERGERKSGQAILVLVVDLKGNVIEADIKESKPTPAFGISAQRAVKHWHYPKVLRNGQPTKFIVQQVVAFD